MPATALRVLRGRTASRRGGIDMGIFFRSKSDGCEDNGGHDQSGPHTREDLSTGKASTVVDCKKCGHEWEYDENGRRK